MSDMCWLFRWVSCRQRTLTCFCLRSLWTSVHLEIWFLVVALEWDLPFMFRVAIRMLVLDCLLIVGGWFICDRLSFGLFVSLASVPISKMSISLFELIELITLFLLTKKHHKGKKMAHIPQTNHMIAKKANKPKKYNKHMTQNSMGTEQKTILLKV